MTGPAATDRRQGQDLGPSTAVRAADEIRRRIFAGEYAPGERLRERDLSEALSISRIPVREALARLEADGFVVASPRRGATVRALTLKDVDELFDLRLSLEVMAARRAAEAVATGGGGTRLRELMDAAEDATRRGDANEIPAANTALHAEIVAMTGNRMLENALKPSLGLMQWLFTMTSDRDMRVQCSEHKDICQAIYAGNADLAAALAYSHIELGRAPSLASLVDVLPAT
ncbi:GntR family transcriptional regulator [Saccharopolyspora shandongensis]|uniref:Transcriptional regulator, GntR family n=1 Tax=Saccharopolyspora shandongensis TaxID=418495 RepID=A0A1H3T5E7_9PSEU|nr:GntR family transcriptional regulator [Saccharopolyspora shandongensis]SDZ45270.1 transcriptional regulator, GntR family [Saccharopolyspora shandongensis]